jgi:site-specific recombinase XerD
VLRLIKRHLKACCKTSESDFECESRVAGPHNKAAGKKIPKPRCPFHIVGPHPIQRGKIFKESTETSDQRIAQTKLLQRETQFLLDPDRVQPKAVKTLGEAVTAFLNTKTDTSDSRQRKLKRVLRKQTVFLEQKLGRGPIVTQIEKTDLDQFVDSWAGALSTRKTDRENVRQFWLYCFDSDFTPKNVASRLKKLGTKRDEEEGRNKPIPIFQPDEVAAFDAALDRCQDIFRRENEQDPDASVKTRAFMYVIKFTGLSIVDVVTLRPKDIESPTDGSTSISIDKMREKTKKIAHTGIPRFVWAMLQELKPESEYFFWSGNGKSASRVDTFRDRMKKLFVAAGIRVRQKTARKKSGGKLKQDAETFLESTGFPHMWRHTLVRDLYLRDVPVRQIADILGDEPATVTKHYSQFDQLRQRKAMATLGGLHRSDPVFQRHDAPHAA